MIDTVNGNHTEIPATEKPVGKPWVAMMVATDGQYLVHGAKRTDEPVDRYLMPWINPQDTRLFVRNGELIKPYGIVVFKFNKIDERPELGWNEARYHEVVRSEFDPTGCVEIKFMDMEKMTSNLNASYVETNKLPGAITDLIAASDANKSVAAPPAPAAALEETAAA